MFNKRFFQQILSIILLALSCVIESVSQTPYSEGEPFVAVEQMPEFPGGMSELNKYISKSLHIHHTDCMERVMRSHLHMTFIISAQGHAEFHSCTPACAAAEVRRMLQGMPCWKPGIQSGKAVAVRYSVPMHICGGRE